MRSIDSATLLLSGFYNQGNGQGMAKLILPLLLAFILPFGLPAATLTATLKPSTVNLGNSAILTLRCEGGVASTVRAISTPKSLALSYVSSGVDTSLNNGQRTINSTFTYHVIPRAAGRFAIPPFKTMVAGKEIRSKSLTLTVLDKNGTNKPQNIAQRPPLALLRVNTPVKKVYVGEVFPVTVELLAWRLHQKHLPVPQVNTKDIRFIRKSPKYRQGSPRKIGGILYQNVFLFDMEGIAMKPGKLKATFEVDVSLLDFTQDPFGRQRRVNLFSDPITLEVIPHPKDNQPRVPLLEAEQNTTNQLRMPLLDAEQNTAVKKSGFKGSVKSVKLSKFVVTEKFGEEVREGGLSSLHKFDKKGYSVERVRYDSNGTIAEKRTYKYDAKGNTPEGEVYSVLSHDANGTITGKTIYKNDAKGNTEEGVDYGVDGKITRKFTIKYGFTPRKNNKWWVPQIHLLGTMNIVEYVEYDAKGKIAERFTNHYDAKGNRVESVEYKPNGDIDIKGTYKYDAKGNVAEIVYYKPNGDIDEKRTYKYDAKGNMVESVYYKPNGDIDRKGTYKYDAKGNVAEIVEYKPNGDIDRKWTYKYDAKGNRVESVEYMLKTGFGEKRLIRTILYTWDYTYWN